MPGEIALRMLEKYLLRGPFLAKLQASSIVSKKVKNSTWVKSSYKFISVIDYPDHFQNRFNPL